MLDILAVSGVLKVNETRLPPNIAIVDDERDLIDVYTRLFRLKKLNISYVASNGLEAVELYRRAPVKPDIIIMDNRMPVMNGIDAMKAIGAIDGGAKFIVLSADVSIRDEVTRMGAVFLKKPASLQALMKAIESLSVRHDDHKSRGSSSSGGFIRRAAGI